MQQPVIDPSDKAWLETASYEELLMHFALGSVRNKYHNGYMGLYFSQMLDSKRNQLDASKINQIHQKIPKGSHDTLH